MMGLVVHTELALMPGLYEVTRGEAEPKDALVAALFKMMHEEAA